MNAVWRKLKEWEHKKRASYSHDIVDPEERKKSLHFLDWIDHGILRYRWHNFHQVAPLFYRSNHPNDERFAAYAALGIKTILNLRGATPHSPYHFEVESCEKHGLKLIDLPMSARQAPSQELLINIMQILEDLDDSTLVHCKSGADRTGIVSAIYLLHVLGRPTAEAQTMLSFKFVHLNFTKTGILDFVIDSYAKRQAETGISFKDWVHSEYNAEKATQDFDDMGFFQRIKL